MDGKDTFQFQNGDYFQDAGGMDDMEENKLGCTKRTLIKILLFYVFSQLSKENVIICFIKSERWVPCVC